ncbi:hypothetical protein AAZX31_18G133000 [Glycine max]
MCVCNKCYPPHHGKVISKTFAILILINHGPRCLIYVCLQQMLPSFFFSQFGLIYVCLQQMLPSSSWEGDFQNLCNFDFDQPRAKLSYLCVFAANATLLIMGR